MAERSLSERISLALQEQVYSLAASVNQSVDEVLGAIDSVLDAHEAQQAKQPAYTINIQTDKDPKVVAEEVIAQIKDFSKQAKPAPSKTGGSGVVQTSLSREQLLREVYRYMRDNSRVYASSVNGTRGEEIENNNAGVVEGLEWVPGYLVENFARHIKEEFNTDGKHPYMG